MGSLDEASPVAAPAADAPAIAAPSPIALRKRAPPVAAPTDAPAVAPAEGVKKRLRVRPPSAPAPAAPAPALAPDASAPAPAPSPSPAPDASVPAPAPGAATGRAATGRAAARHGASEDWEKVQPVDVEIGDMLNVKFGEGRWYIGEVLEVHMYEEEDEQVVQVRSDEYPTLRPSRTAETGALC
jgi:hypothetical protein